MNRRTFLCGTAAAGTAALAGCLGLFEDGPDEVAESFVEALDAGEFAAAEEFLHPASPVDGAGQAADVIAAIYGVDGVVEALDISVEDSRVIAESDDEATVAVTVAVDLVVEEAEGDIPFQMRTDDGDWYVWSVSQ